MKRNNLLKTLAVTLAVTSLGAITPYIANAGTWHNGNQGWYYINDNGSMATGWNQIDGNWYYMWSDGTMAKNTWVESNGQWYYLGENGAMVYNTIIDGCIIGSEGNWTTTLRGKLTLDDVMGEHDGRKDLIQGSEDLELQNKLTSSNIDCNTVDVAVLKTIPKNLAKQRIYISELKNQCLGKVFNNKYVISDIKYYAKTFYYSEYQRDKKSEGIQQSDLVSYKSNSPYVYDIYSVYSTESDYWLAVRVVIEFEVL